MTRRLPIIPVEVGQVRRDPDPRLKGARTVTVQVVGGRHVSVITNAGRYTRILTDALAKWPIVEPSETP
jgi:hypothetical protein